MQGNGAHCSERDLQVSTQRIVAELWREVLQTQELPGPDDDFFALGGDSMAMATVEFRIMEELAVQLSPGATLGAPTLRELSTLVDQLRR